MFEGLMVCLGGYAITIPAAMQELEFTHFSSEKVRLTLKTKGEVRFWKWFWAFSVRTALAVVKVEQCCETRQ